MLEKLDQIEEQALKALEHLEDEEALLQWRAEYLGKKSVVMEAFTVMRELSQEERPLVGKRANEVRQALESALEERRAKAKQQALESARAFLSTDNLVCETKLIFSESNKSAGEQLVRFAKEQKVDMIVVGIKKISRVGKVITGSNAQHIILNADCQVITAK